MGMTDVELEQHDKLNSIIETLNTDKTGNIAVSYTHLTLPTILLV